MLHGRPSRLAESWGDSFIHSMAAEFSCYPLVGITITVP
jgi:hypothetical protein